MITDENQFSSAHNILSTSTLESKQQKQPPPQQKTKMAIVES